ncbi:hypothetical protein ES288_D13G141700v1 [Gossypium darwinii]|uniref:Uncharacterized protein n=1 Tax=Gossypium darwinii TaxID=34276 RepID=A0A5D1ZXV2_GOSDA|nr:hypothetical protein ES288_D13G141700v1 [Gossypium darwinii]
MSFQEKLDLNFNISALSFTVCLRNILVILLCQLMLLFKTEERAFWEDHPQVSFQKNPLMLLYPSQFLHKKEGPKRRVIEQGALFLMGLPTELGGLSWSNFLKQKQFLRMTEFEL